MSLVRSVFTNNSGAEYSALLDTISETAEYPPG